MVTHRGYDKGRRATTARIS